MQFHTQSAEDTLRHLDATTQGLNTNQVKERQTKYGLNQLEERGKKTAWQILLHQFKDFMILILIAATIISGIAGDIVDTVIILLIVLLNAVFGFVQEYQAERALESLKKMARVVVKVLRNGHYEMLDSVQLVPGDIISLEAGQTVPADVRWIETHSIKADESALTGESVPVEKYADLIVKEDTPLGDRKNLSFKGTLITNGRGIAVVTHTGMQTEIGKIAGLLQTAESETPLKKRMAAFGKYLTYGVIMICIILLVVGLLRGEEPIKMIMVSISLAVAAIPEALPALVTVALARGAAKMARVNALVRNLPAVETLGSVTFICTDKTGTLTLNKMEVQKTYALSSSSVLSEIELMALNHDVKRDADSRWNGDPTEVALADYAFHQSGAAKYDETHQRYPRLAEIPFDSDRKCMTTLHKYSEGYLSITKGAPENIARLTTDEATRQQLLQQAERWSNEGLRVLAYGIRRFQQMPEEITPQHIENNLQAVLMVAMMDPPRPEAAQAIAECKTAGIKPVMITGDHPLTAAAIARKIGIIEPADRVVTGSELQAMSDDVFLKEVEHIAVYARVSPEQKLRIVKALQHKQHFVAMTGDGVNDAPSLKTANIGVAMGINGTDVSKEASDMVLLDDNFATIVKAVKEGRRIFDNIRKFVKYIMTCNSAEIWTLFLAPFMGLPIPLLPVHILWINLVTDGLPGLALAAEKAEGDIMKRPPRPVNESLFAGGIGYHILWVGLLMAAVTLITQAVSIQNDWHWQTMVFTVLSLSQLGHVLAIRTNGFLYSSGIFSNMKMIAAVGFTFLLQLIVIYVPLMHEVFRTESLTLNELLICIAISAVVFHAVEFEKWVKQRRMKG